MDDTRRYHGEIGARTGGTPDLTLPLLPGTGADQFLGTPAQVSVNGRQSIESAISRLRTDINTECSPAVLPDQDSMLSGLLEIYERYTPILPRHLRATTDSPEESPSSIGRQTDEPCAISALTAEIEQLEFERDAVLDALRQYEEEGHARDGGPDVSLALAEVCDPLSRSLSHCVEWLSDW